MKTSIFILINAFFIISAHHKSSIINPCVVDCQRVDQGKYRLIFLTNQGTLYPITLFSHHLNHRTLLRMLIENQEYPIHINVFKDYPAHLVRSYIEWCFKNNKRSNSNHYEELITIFDLRND